MESISDFHLTALSSLSQFSVLYYTPYQNVWLKKKKQPTLKNSSESKETFFKEDIQMADMKRCSASLIGREMQIKTESEI